MKHLSSDFIKKALSNTVWDFGNQVLYDLCASSPAHVKDEIIIAKIWLIGRSYAAAIERRHKGKTIDDGDDIYEKTVAPKIRKSDIDSWFHALASDKGMDTSLSLQIHKEVTDLFNSISGDEKRSLASKYLHFHFPERFYIYDSRAQKSITMLTKGVGRKPSVFAKYDDTYARFFLRCQSLNDAAKGFIGRLLSPRELDKVLLEWCKP